MAKLSLTREHVAYTNNIAMDRLSEDEDDVSVQEMVCYSQDWLSLYDENEKMRELLGEIADHFGIEHREHCKSETSIALGCDCGAIEVEDKIRTLIGGQDD